jgi:hypothetical protein
MEKGDALTPNCKDEFVIRGTDLLLENKTISLLYRMCYVCTYIHDYS